MMTRFTRTSLILVLAPVLGVVGFGAANATGVPTTFSAPVGAAVQSAGGAVSAAGRGHAGVAPTVYSTAPAAEPMADGVTNGLLTLGGGIKATGQSVQNNGLQVSPAAGAQTAVQTVKNGSLVQGRVSDTRIGSSASNPIIGAGALTNAPPQGTLATAGVGYTNDLLSGTVAPQ